MAVRTRTMVKISDVARLAGVSSATVSRALNGVDSVDPALVTRVRDAADSLGYRPNAAARNLRSKSSRVWALIIPDIENQFFTTVARGVEDVAHAHGYSLLLCNTDEKEDKEIEYLNVAGQEQVAGVILSPHSEVASVGQLVALGIPFVVIDRTLGRSVDTVRVDSVSGGRGATAHLLDEGWRRPACITGPESAATAVDRLAGYQVEMRARGLSEQELFVREDFKIEGGRRAAQQLLDVESPPDSLVIANSAMTLGVLQELSARRLHLGRDIGLVTFDDAPWMTAVEPGLSVIAQPAVEIGRQAA